MNSTITCRKSSSSSELRTPARDIASATKISFLLVVTVLVTKLADDGGGVVVLLIPSE